MNKKLTKTKLRQQTAQSPQSCASYSAPSDSLKALVRFYFKYANARAYIDQQIRKRGLNRLKLVYEVIEIDGEYLVGHVFE